ncbi:FRG domain-containing protein [Shewanella algae]|uniref:FRG domain-containing protein n=1 Tax=Shewanella algae TaxID=38313 RepID=UPI001AAD9C39|nr:FRG domain-containing protein [Shewanella algae]MBO2675932.1 FRG domain-containing protein [Shewanella algae]MCE9779867.1 FRG domain-containing protein [Shewanella algae]MCE9826230.1 FRG domain-containing protein [Shewanella algae]
MAKAKEVKSISDLIRHLKKDISSEWGPVWYRGQADINWELLSSYDRLKEPPTETTLVNKFRQNASFLMDKKSPSNDFEWLFMMQHYGVPTRLLDWTENPLISLYFAVNGENSADGILWILSPHSLNSNTNGEKYIPAFEEGEYLGSYTTEKYDKGKDKGILPIAAIATRNNSRIQAQMGVFTISHWDKTPLDQIGSKKHIIHYVIPNSHKKNIREELAILGVTKFSVFPELQSIGEMIKGELV